jgi:hypothetical protein
VYTYEQVGPSAELSFQSGTHRPMVLEQKVDPIACAKLVLQLEDNIRAKVQHGRVFRHA